MALQDPDFCLRGSQQRGDPRRKPYAPIREYAAIGDCHGGALVARDGGIDWCCLRRFDAEPALARLLDVDRGGFLDVSVVGALRRERAYVRHTNVLRSRVATATGELAITDFMPVARAPGAGPYDYTTLVAPGWLVRRFEVVTGFVPIECTWRPSLGFGIRSPDLARRGDRVACVEGPLWIESSLPFALEGRCALAREELHAGERRYLVLGDGRVAPNASDLDALLEATVAFWQEWLGYSRYRGRYRAAVERSALVLKLMTYAPTGASVAALTTSLPEEIGGERNWDYRFCWIRDASLASHALSALGYAAESRALYEFLRGPLHGGLRDLQVLYGIEGERALDERVIPQWQGYACSAPVRSGNAACRQRQMDLYGYLFEGARIYQCLGGDVTAEDRRHLAAVVDYVAAHWAEPDMGLWEMRSAPRQFVHSKAMCWLVVHRGLELLGERPEWEALRDRIWDAIWNRGRIHGHFVQSLDEADPRVVDAALLQLPLLGLPVDRATMAATRQAIEKELRHGDFVRRYLHRGDGLPGTEGAFLICSFWLVDSLLWEGKASDAEALFERLLRYAQRRRTLLGGDRPLHRRLPRQLPAGVHPLRPRQHGGQSRSLSHPRRSRPARRLRRSRATQRLGDPRLARRHRARAALGPPQPAFLEVFAVARGPFRAASGKRLGMVAG